MLIKVVFFKKALVQSSVSQKKAAPNSGAAFCTYAISLRFVCLLHRIHSTLNSFNIEWNKVVVTWWN